MHAYIWEEGAYEYIYMHIYMFVGKEVGVYICVHIYMKRDNECVKVCMHICHEHGDQKLMLGIWESFFAVVFVFLRHGLSIRSRSLTCQLAGQLPPGMLSPPSKAGIMAGFPFQALTWILGIRITVPFHAEEVNALTDEISS